MSPAAARVLRCWVEPAVALLVAAALLLWWMVAEAALVRITTLTGWILAVLLAFLLCNAPREMLLRITRVPARFWYRLHAWVGILTGVTVAIHTGLHVPHGPIEALATLLFITTFLLGIVGLWVSQSIPLRIASIPTAVEAGAIAQHRREVHQAVEEVALRHAESTGDDAVANAYDRELRQEFEVPRHRLAHLINTSRVRRGIDRRITARQRRLNEPACAALEEIRRLASAKADLDELEACHAFRNTWLATHLLCSSMLGVLVVFHAVISLTYAGGAP